jgi:S-phase kinase-associated protein 1
MSIIKTFGDNINDAKIISVLSNEGGMFSVEKSIIYYCLTVKNMIENLGMDDDCPIPLLHESTSNEITQKVFEFCEYIHFNPEETKLLEEWTNDRTFVIPLPPWFQEYIEIDQKKVFSLILATNYLDIPLLLNFCCKYVASLIRNKTSEEMRALFAQTDAAQPEADVSASSAASAPE